MLMMPQALASAVPMPIAGRLFDRIGARPLVLSGILLVAYSSYRLSSMNLVTSEWEIRLTLLMRGGGMGLMMMQVMTVAMNTVPPHLVGRASSLTTVLRQVFASFGTATFATIVQTRQAFHQAMLSQAIVAGAPSVQATVFSLQHYVLQNGASATQARAAAITALSQQVTLGASVRAYDDAFLLASMVMLIGFLPALFLRGTGVRVAPRRPPAAGSGA